MEGRFCCVEPVDPARHAADLHTANSLDREGRNWTYLPYGPFARLEDYRSWLDRASAGDDPLFHAIIERQSGRAVGVASYMRIDPAAGVIEVGGINYAPPLQRTPAATEAMYLMMRRVFDELGYRRYEWKCDVAECAVTRCGAAPGFPIRRHVPPGDGLQGAQSRHLLVLDPRQRMAGAEAGFRAVARPRQFRSERSSAPKPLEPYRRQAWLAIGGVRRAIANRLVSHASA